LVKGGKKHLGEGGNKEQSSGTVLKVLNEYCHMFDVFDIGGLAMSPICKFFRHFI
jgi:hypothetical protein